MRHRRNIVASLLNLYRLIGSSGIFIFIQSQQIFSRKIDKRERLSEVEKDDIEDDKKKHKLKFFSSLGYVYKREEKTGLFTDYFCTTNAINKFRY